MKCYLSSYIDPLCENLVYSLLLTFIICQTTLQVFLDLADLLITTDIEAALDSFKTVSAFKV